MQKYQSVLLGIFLIAASIGFFDASYLTANHYLGVVPPCIAVSGCESVTTSSYSKILGIPVALLGAIFYLCASITGLYYFDKRKKIALEIMVTLGIIGLLMSTWFLYVQAFIIREFCTYCIISAITSTTLCITSLLLYQEKTKSWWQKIKDCIS